MHVRSLSLQHFRSYADAHLELQPGITTLLGRNGAGKTNLIEAVCYVSTLGSHRVATDAPLVQAGAVSAVVRAEIVQYERAMRVEIEICPGRANRSRINGSPTARSRDVLGVLRTVLFAPDDLALVKGDPGDRRRFLDDVLVARTPRLAGVRSDYDRVLKQRNALLKSVGGLARSARSNLPTLDVWDASLARAGAQMLAARLALVADLRPLVERAYAQLSDSDVQDGGEAVTGLEYRCSAASSDAEHAGEDRAGEANLPRAVAELEELLLAALRNIRGAEIDRGVSLVGPHRDEVALSLGVPPLPAKGYASHGESWSLALALRLASYELLRADGTEPVLVLDDVLAELDAGRRDRLAELVRGAEQVLITAADPSDVPSSLQGMQVAIPQGVLVSPERVGRR